MGQKSLKERLKKLEQENKKLSKRHKEIHDKIIENKQRIEKNKGSNNFLSSFINNIFNNEDKLSKENEQLIAEENEITSKLNNNNFEIDSLKLQIKKRSRIPLAICAAILAVAFTVVGISSCAEKSSKDITELPTFTTVKETSISTVDEITETETTVSNKTESTTIEITTEETTIEKTTTTATKPTKKESVVPKKIIKAKNFKLSSIPKFSNKAYVTVNNNKPYFKSSEYTTKSFEKYSNLDKWGRCGTAYACIGKDIMPTEKRGAIGMVKPSGWHTVKYECVSGKYLYNRCHLIAYELAAENANEKNLITGTRYMNIEGMLPFENKVADYVNETNNHVLYRVTPVFSGKNLLATGVLMEGYSVEDHGSGISFNVFCYNAQPGVKITYATGDSKLKEKAKPVKKTVKKKTVKKKTETKKKEKTTYAPATQAYTEAYTVMVWIPNSGSKYHSYAGCSNMKNPSQVTENQAINMGYEPCKKCW